MSGRWLITGASGQLGRSLLALAPALGIRAEGRAHEELDVADADGVRRALDGADPDVVVNCAAFTKVDLCEERPDDARRANADGPGVLAEACRDRALLVHLSTEYVFAGDAARPLAEDDPTEPRSEYGRSKLAGERAIREAGCDHLIVRTQWLFGPGPNFVRTMLDAARARRTLRVVEDQLGRPTWTGALARALVAAVEAGARGTLHLAGSGVASWYDLAVAAISEGARRGISPAVAVHPVGTTDFPRPAERPAQGVLDLSRARKLGVELPHWRQALSEYLDSEEEGRDA